MEIMPLSTNNTSRIKSLAKELLRIDELDFPPKLLEALEDIVKESRERMSKEVGDFLFELDHKKHTEKQVKDVISVFPESLSCTNEQGRLPIQHATYNRRSMSFIPLLAQQGILYCVGAEENRGGLLLVHPGVTRNTIQVLSYITAIHEADDNLMDKMALGVLKRLRTMDFLAKEDVTKFNLLAWPEMQKLEKCKLRFQYLLDWGPDALKEARIYHVPILHWAASENTADGRERFKMILGASLRHFPDSLGLLFQKHNGKTACEAAVDNYGQRETMDIIRRCIPPSDNLPILHHVYVHANKYMELFSLYYPDAEYTRDANNRTLFQVILASGTKRFNEHARFFLRATDEQISEKDPVTKLFPFALAASGDTSDLDAVYMLLRRDPNLIWGAKANKRNRGRKRNIDATK